MLVLQRQQAVASPMNKQPIHVYCHACNCSVVCVQHWVVVMKDWFALAFMFLWAEHQSSTLYLLF